MIGSMIESQKMEADASCKRLSLLVDQKLKVSSRVRIFFFKSNEEEDCIGSWQVLVVQISTHCSLVDLRSHGVYCSKSAESN